MGGEGAAVLGIDAGRTSWEPSGVALWQLTNAKWNCLRVAPSYASFCGDIDWEAAAVGGAANVAGVLATCRRLLGGRLPAVVAASVPLARGEITGRRACDTLINKRYSRRKCAIQAPTSRRPGSVGVRLQQGFKAAGFQLVSAAGRTGPVSGSLIEVYPHVAMLGLMRRAERVPYKAFNTQTYWPGLSVRTRRQLLLQEWRSILWRLGKYVGAIDVPLPKSLERWTFARLKRFEDAIDALVCAWMAAEFLCGETRALGNDKAAIWVPLNAL